MTDEGAPDPIEVPGDGVDRFLNPKRQRALASLVHTGREVEGRPVGGEVHGYHVAKRLGWDACNLGGSIRGPRLGNGS